MSKVKCLFKTTLLVAFGIGFGALAAAEEPAVKAPEFKKQTTGLYRDIFDQNVYYEGTNYLHLERFYRDLFGKKVRAGNVNLFDEVPDSLFFTNRHARQSLSETELIQGYHENAGPDLSGDLVAIKGKFEGLNPGFFIKDAAGDSYLLKFDNVDSFELATAAEIIACRFYYAIGYNVPQNTILEFSPEKLVPSPEAKIVDESGFKKKLTPERLEEFLLFVPQTEDGKFRASASKTLEGENKGYFSFYNRRKNDPNDPVEHSLLREIRALQVFSSWLNNYDVRESNSLELVVDNDGNKVLKHYLIDFNSSLGAAAKGAKPPMFTHEYMFDYGETFKAFLSLGWWEKPWQKRWREAGERPTPSPAVGYFDNHYFNPAAFKIQFPHYPFKDLTRADGFWAAKIIMTFTDDQIKSIVSSGQLSRAEDAATITQTLIERRDILGRYWFGQVNPLDLFDVQSGKLIFEDLAVRYGFEKAEGTSYEAQVVGRQGKKKEKITTLQGTEPSFSIDTNWLSRFENVDFWIRTSRNQSKEMSPPVLVSVDSQGVAQIAHQD